MAGLTTQTRWNDEPKLREKLMFGVAVLGVVVLFFDMLFTPLSERRETLLKDEKAVAAQVKSVQSAIAKMKEDLASRVQAVRPPPKMDERSRRILGRKFGDVGEETTAIVDVLGGRHVASRVKVQKVSVGQQVDMQSYIDVPLSIELQGTYTAVLNYLEFIERIDQPLFVKAVRLQREREGGGTLQVVLTIEFYVPVHRT